ncbi:MAG: hypothetical protein H7A21_00565 [Spirochaetales bacterium]|nr:hypothetical protein [Leptospiraceae bacterium]MCP5479902.1 hypothetical protein [Spirochaetales bacterium]
MQRMKVPTLFLVLLTNACSSYEVFAIRTQLWPGDVTRDVGIGEFAVSGARRETQEDFPGALAFALYERGFAVTEQPVIQESMMSAGLPTDRLLVESEAGLLGRGFGGRLLLQGKLQETRTRDLLEDREQVLLEIEVLDVRLARNLGSIRTFATDLAGFGPRENLEMARRSALQLDEMIGEVR